MDAILPVDPGKSPGGERRHASFVTGVAGERTKFLDFSRVGLEKPRSRKLPLCVKWLWSGIMVNNASS
ncbi:hypothetical protein, partial [uncultured Corynebacterium sp.]|uniref:hypothetical protein n=1 Tax=uncultured Corynebacterium sp. TaxID=159447 RepID=UPI002889B713